MINKLDLCVIEAPPTRAMFAPRLGGRRLVSSSIHTTCTWAMTSTPTSSCVRTLLLSPAKKTKQKTDSERLHEASPTDWTKRRENGEIILLLVSGPSIKRSLKLISTLRKCRSSVLKQSVQPETQPTVGMNFIIPHLSLWCNIFNNTWTAKRNRTNKTKNNLSDIARTLHQTSKQKKFTFQCYIDLTETDHVQCGNEPLIAFLMTETLQRIFSNDSGDTLEITNQNKEEENTQQLGNEAIYF